MAEKKTTEDRNATQDIHTPGGMNRPPAQGDAADAADIAATDTSVDTGGSRADPSPTITRQPTDAGAGAGAGAASGLADELAELRERHLRLAAEFDNYRKRVSRERLELSDRAQANFVGRLLEVLDDLDRLVASDPNTPVQALREGMLMVDRKLRKELESAGVERIEPTGEPFDPSQHEAVSIVPAPEPSKDHLVSATFQVGYRFKGALVRPARVQVFSTQGND